MAPALGLGKAKYCADCHIEQHDGELISNHRICAEEGIMTTIHRQTKRIATWLNRATTCSGELKLLSDRSLEDIGLSRYRPNVDTYKPFWLV